MICINSNNYSNAWAIAIQNVMKFGTVRPSIANSSKMLKHLPLAFELDREAIEQALRGELHPQNPQQHGLDIYCNQFMDGTDAAIQSRGSQPYTYMGRTLSQFNRIARDHLLDDEFNKRIQVVTWDKFEDLGAENPPCWQLVDLVNIGNGQCEVTTMFRSHDLFGAWQFNNVALLRYFTKEVLEPANLIPVKFIEFNSSLHIYDYDWASANKVSVIPSAISKQVMR